MRDHKVTVSVIIALLTILTALPVQAQDTKEKSSLLETIPADCLGCVKINNLNNALEQADKFTEGLIPSPMGIKQTAMLQLSGIIGNPNMAGIDMSGEFGCLLKAGDNNQPPGVFIFTPVTDYREFLKNSANRSETDANDISIFNITGKKAVSRKLGNFAVFTNEESYRKLLALPDNPGQTLAEVLPPEELEKTIKTTVWIYGNIEQTNEKYGEFIRQQMDKGKQIIKDTQNANPGMQNPAAIMDFYYNIFDAFLTETKYFSKAINIQPELLSVNGCLAAREETEMAEMFTASNPKSPNPLLGYFENGSFLNLAFNMKSELFAATQMKSMELMGFESDQETTTEMKQLIKESLEVFGEWGVYSCKLKSDQTPPFVVKYVTELDNPEELDKVIDKGKKFWEDGKFSEFMEQFGLKVNYSIRKDISSYNGVSIDSAKLTIQPADSNSPTAAIINQIYGGGLDYRWGVVEDKFVCAVGAEPNQIIRGIIDKVTTGEGKTIKSETRNALNILEGNPAKADFMCTLSYLRMLEFIFLFTPESMGTAESPAITPALKNIFEQSSTNIAFSGTAADNKLISRAAVPKKHIREIISAFMMLQQQQMQQKMQQTPQFQQSPKPQQPAE